MEATPIIPRFGRLNQEDHWELQASLEYRARHCLYNKTKLNEIQSTICALTSSPFSPSSTPAEPAATRGLCEPGAEAKRQPGGVEAPSSSGEFPSGRFPSGAFYSFKPTRQALARNDAFSHLGAESPLPHCTHQMAVDAHHLSLVQQGKTELHKASGLLLKAAYERNAYEHP